MRSLWSAWLATVIIAVLALLAMKALTPEAGSAAADDEYAEIYRIHLPWLLFCVLMAFSAGAYQRDRTAFRWRLLAAAPVPLIAAVTGVVIDVPPAHTALALLLRLIETLLGIALGLILSDFLSERLEGRTASDGAVWRETQ
ncbi:hypothetical protein [Spirillospora sp. NPDC047279]|uniref:hypothetical protein n=1 Tax=Spirillospora sp. NPDC047279 TaxID=3155478 RepID=UPI0033E0DB24